MKKRKILVDRQMPGADEIRKHQDFQKIQQNYSVMKSLLVKKIFLSVAAVAVLGAAIALFINHREKPATTPASLNAETVSKQSPCVQPPLPGLEKQFTAFKIDASGETVLTYSTGSRIIIPAHTFSVGGHDSIIIKYREYHDVLDIFLSGIPMQYDSAGLVRTLESAGMLEIRAFDGEKELQVQDGKEIRIEMASDNPETRFNLYYMDTLQKNWIYEGKDHVMQPAPAQQAIRPGKVEKQAPLIKPELPDPDKYSFTITYNKSDFPELSAYDHVKFEACGTDFKPVYYKINWNMITVRAAETEGRYKIGLHKSDTTVYVDARPVFEGKDYQHAMQQFNAAAQRVESESTMKEAEQKVKIGKINNELSQYNSSVMLNAARRMNTLSTVRVFSIPATGIHNCDFPLSPVMAYALSVQDIRKQNKSSAIVFTDIYIVEKGINTVRKFNLAERLAFNPAKKNLFWTITQNNEIAFFREADMARIVRQPSVAVPTVARNQDEALKRIREFSGES